MLPPHLKNQYPVRPLHSSGTTPVVVFRRAIPAGGMVEVELKLTAQRATTFGVAAFRRVLRADNEEGTATVRTDAGPVLDYNPSSYTVAASIDGVDLIVTVTGVASHEIDWTVTELAL